MIRAHSRHAELKHFARETGARVRDLIALAPNNDPFYSGTEAHGADARWFSNLWQAFGYTGGIHLRRMHYQILSRGEPRRDGKPYENTEACWQDLLEAAKHARYQGLVAADAFEDHRNPDPRILAESGNGGSPRLDLDLEGWGPPYLPAIPERLIVDPFEIPEIEIAGYGYRPADQAYLLEIWIEKSTMSDILEPICRRFGANLVTSIGFQSVTAAVQLCRRVEETGKPARVLYISDFDPAGVFMPKAVARQIEFWSQKYAPTHEIKLKPIALTYAQVQKYRLPRIPIKDTDRRREGFESRHETGAVELDALEALHPGELGRIVENAIRPYWDESLERRLQAQSAAVADATAEDWQIQIAAQAREMESLNAQAQEIAGAYTEELQALSSRYEADLESIRGRLESVWQAIKLARDRFSPELPPRVRPEPPGADESDWLLDTSREYMEQLEAYKGGPGMGK